MRRMGLIKECVTTVSYSILFEGLEVGPIFPQRGLRQALSPYLFIICAEGFHALLRKAEREGLIHGVKVLWASVSHLFFADDSLLF